MDTDYRGRVGGLVRDARRQRGWTQERLAQALKTSQSAVARLEQGRQNVSLDLLARVGAALDTGIVQLGHTGPTHLRVKGGRSLSGAITVKSSKNAAVALLCAALLNDGRTLLREVARIEEVDRILEVLRSIGVEARWVADSSDIEIQPRAPLRLDRLDVDAARRTRSVLLLLGPLLHRAKSFKLPYAGGCELGTRTVEPHKSALSAFGVAIGATAGHYRATRGQLRPPSRPLVLVERGDTVTENALMAAARLPGTTVIRNASSNYMVQDLCCYLRLLGVEVEGVGTTTLTVHGQPEINVDVEYYPSEDPIEAMSLITAAVVTGSQVRIERVPVEFVEVELAVLEGMGLQYERSAEYPARNGLTRLIDLTTHASELRAPLDKVHPMPYPGLNIDNVPFFALIGAVATGSTLIHDWVYENRAIYLTELNRLGGHVTLLDPHRVLVTGPTRWSAAEVMCPPALRPAVVLLLAMLAAPGESVLRNVYVINRGYEALASRLGALGARIEPFRDI